MFDFDECVYRLEILFEDLDSIDDDAVVLDLIDATLFLCGGREGDEDEMIEAISTAAHNANVNHYIGGLLGVE